MVASKAAGQEDRDRSVSVTVTDREYEAAVIESLKDRTDKSSDVDKEVGDLNYTTLSAVISSLPLLFTLLLCINMMYACLHVSREGWYRTYVTKPALSSSPSLIMCHIFSLLFSTFSDCVSSFSIGRAQKSFKPHELNTISVDIK